MRSIIFISFFCIVYTSSDVGSKFMSLLAYMHSQLYFYQLLCLHKYFSFKLIFVNGIFPIKVVPYIIQPFQVVCVTSKVNPMYLIPAHINFNQWDIYTLLSYIFILFCVYYLVMVLFLVHIRCNFGTI